jgi:hypothetical protein
VYVASVTRFKMRNLAFWIVVPVYDSPHPTLKLEPRALEHVVGVLELQMLSVDDGHGGAT